MTQPSHSAPAEHGSAGAQDRAADAAAREAAFDAEVERNLKRNFTANFIHGMLGLTGFRLIYAPTFIPAYIQLMTGSALFVGLGQTLLMLGGFAVPILGASQLEHRRHILAVSLRIGTLMRVQVLGLALAGWLLSGTPLLVATMLLFLLLGLFQGLQRVAFQMIIAKVIPLDRRGRLQGMRNLAGGAIAAGLSYTAGHWLIDEKVLGNGYATTFLLAFVLTSLGLIVLKVGMKEPEAPSVRLRMPVRERLTELPALLAERNYRWFLIGQALAVTGRVSAPFCILYAARVMALDGATIGVLSLAFLGADTASNILWGQLGDRFGYRLTFLLSILCWIAAIVLLLFADTEPLIVIAFIGLGAANSGYLMSAQTMVLELGNREDMPMRLALSTTVEGFIATLGPLLAGVVVHVAGYVALLGGTAALLVAAALAFWLRVTEPRHRIANAPIGTRRP